MVIAYFTPVTGICGGALIGLSAAILLIFSGDILAASCISSSIILSPRKALTDPSVTWRLAFFSSFLLLSNTVLGPHFSYDERLEDDPSIPIVSVYGYLIAGFLSGFGTRLGNGCTSGHGICGMARLSKRSIIAVFTFMGTAWATATLTAPGMSFHKITDFLRTDRAPKVCNRWLGFYVSIFFVIFTICALYNLWKYKEKKGIKIFQKCAPEQVVKIQSKSSERSQDERTETQREEEDGHALIHDSLCKLIPAAIAGSIFAVGLALSQMVLQSKVFGFLNLYLFAEGSFDPTLAVVMAGGCFISWISYQFVRDFSLFPNPYARKHPIMVRTFNVPTSQVVDAQLLGGAICFGIGWAIGGLCPGPAIFLAACGSEPVLYWWWPTFLVGSLLAQKWHDSIQAVVIPE